MSIDYLIRPVGNVWVAVQEGLDRKKLVERIRGRDVCVSDLDETDAKSPAKAAAWHFLPRNILEPRFFLWGLRTGWDLLRDGKASESACWKRYAELLSPEERKRHGRWFTQERVRASLYPGVEDFYAALPPAMQCVYFTRNIAEVAEPFAAALGIGEVRGEVYNKGAELERFIAENPTLRHYLVKGDSEEDLAMVAVLHAARNRGAIDSFVSCLVTPSPYHRLRGHFTVNIGQDYRGLVELMRDA